MMQWILAQTNLPSLHPALVHFPIVLWLLAVAAEVLVLLRRDRGATHGRTLAGIYVLAFGSALVTWWSGRQAANAVGLVDAETEVLIAQHSDTALQTLWILGVSATGRVAVEVLRAHIEASMRLVLRLLVLVPALIGVWMVGLTADRGGGLVYGHAVGVAVERAPTQNTIADPGASATEVWQHLDDGSLEFKGAAGVPSTLDALFETVHEQPFEARMTREEVTDLEVSGEGALLVPESFGDVMMIADLDLSGFRGEISLVHHFADLHSFEAYALSAERVALTEVVGDGAKVFDESAHRWPSAPVRLAVSVTGKHLKGYADGSTVVHGHRPEKLGEGRVGLYVKGEGHIEIRELKVRATN